MKLSERIRNIANDMAADVAALEEEVAARKVIGSTAIGAHMEAEAQLDELKAWCLAALEVIELGVQLMPQDQLREWTAVRTVLETCPVGEDDP